MIAYFVSGDADIAQSAKAITASGRSAKLGADVHDEPAKAFAQGGKFVLVTHGNRAGEILWYKQAWDSRRRWIWTGMDSPPSGIRLYIYACFGGLSVPTFLAQCEAFGHRDEVPMPEPSVEKVVLDFLTEVDRLVADDLFDRAVWRRRLYEYVKGAFAAEVANRTTMLAGAALFMLQQSLEDEADADDEDEAK